jgi:hypothetical protein
MSVTVIDRFRVIVRSPGPQGPAGPAGGGGGGSGTVTGVTAGDGLLGGTITTSGTIDCNFGSSGNTVCEGNDARLSDARTPTAHTHVAGDIGSVTGPALIGRQAATSGTAEAITLGSGLTIDGSKQLTITAAYAQQSVTMTAGTGLTGGGDLSANRTFAVSYGSTASTACEGNDARLSDARTPTAHTHDATDSYVGEIETPAVRTYTIDLTVATARTISALYFITSAGTVDVTLKNGANTVYTADGLGTTKTSVTSGLSNAAVSAGGTITLVVDAVSTPADFSFAIYYTRITGGIS